MLECNYTIKETPGNTDQVLIWDAANSTWRRTSLSAIHKLFLEDIRHTLDIQTQLERPSLDGPFIVTIGADFANKSTDFHLLIDIEDVVNSYKIILPDLASCRDKQKIIVTSTHDIAVLDIRRNRAAALINIPESLVGTLFFTLMFDSITQSWYRIG